MDGCIINLFILNRDVKMEKLIGFYKELDDDEKLLKESPNLVEMYEKRGLIQGYKTIVNISKLGFTNYHLFLQF